MKKIILALIVFGLAFFLGEHLLSQPVAARVASLLEQYNVRVQNLQCRGGFLSRSGHCFFAINSSEVADIRTKLSQNRSAEQPKGQTIMHEIGDAGCRPPAENTRLVSPATQLGGGALPYLGAVVIDPATGRGCLEFTFGYG